MQGRFIWLLEEGHEFSSGFSELCLSRQRMKRPFSTPTAKFSLSWRASSAAVAVRREVRLGSLGRELWGVK